MLKSNNVYLKINLLFLNIIISLFLVCFQWFKVLWVHQVKIYINYLSFKGKGTTKKSHEEDENVEF
jgi:hypothetical protein